MGTADTYVRARIDTATKERATEALSQMGLTVSDAIRLLMLRVADDRCLPFDIRVPNTRTKQAIEELDSGKAQSFASIDDLMTDLSADD